MDWTADLIEADGFPWNVPDIRKLSSAEPGVAGNASLTIEAENEFVATDGDDVDSGDLEAGRWYRNEGYDEVTYDGVDYLDGERFLCLPGVLTYTTDGAGTVERLHTVKEIVSDFFLYNYATLVRISTKSAALNDWTVKFVGVIDPTMLQCEVFDIDDPGTWTIKFDADDILQLLKKVNAAQWMSAGTGMSSPTKAHGGLLRADFDHTASYTYLTFIAKLVRGSDTYWPGRYAMRELHLPIPGKEDETKEFDVFNNDYLRYIKLIDIITQISVFLGCEAEVNDGADWSDVHTWEFLYNIHDSTGTGGVNLVSVGIDDLYVPSGFYESPQYYEMYSLFDPWETGPHSWKRCGDPLEVLDRICSSLGMIYRTRVNASGEMYLEVVECALARETVTVDDMNLVAKITEKQNSLACDGVEIVSTGSALGSANPASNVKKGGGGSSTLRYDCFFLSTNHLITNHDFTRRAGKLGDYGDALITDIRPIDTDFLCSLFVLTGGAGTAKDNAYSICAIRPLDNGDGALAAYSTMPDYGEHRAGGVTFPKETDGDPHYSTYIEVPGMALAHYMYSEAPVAIEPVGFVRPRGDALELAVVGIDLDGSVYPPLKMDVTRNGETRSYVVTEVIESISDDIITYIGHTRAI